MEKENNICQILEKFVNQKIAIKVNNSEEYLGFLNLLESNNIILANAIDWQKNSTFYDSRYPFYFIQDVDEIYMNSNVSIENIARYYSIDECISYEELKDMQEEMER